MPFDNLKPLFSDNPVLTYGEVPVMAGPCSVESRRQVLQTAMELSEFGISLFRAGVWKPRTRPGSFEGLGVRSLPWLGEVRSRFGMTTAVEVATAAHLRHALRSGIRVFWVGARTSANPFAMQELADHFADQSAELLDEVTVLVKNPVNPDLELWVGALQRIYNAGVRRLGAVHRGFSVYGEQLYRNRPEWRIPIELRRRERALPLWCDPSHIAGRRDLVESVAQQALDLDFDGLIIESHCAPEEALSDSAQQLTPADLKAMLSRLRVRRGGSENSLKCLREEIDDIDDRIINLLGRRMDVSRAIGRLKHEEGIPVLQPERYRELIDRRVAQGEDCGISADFMRRYLGLVHEESVRQQICEDTVVKN